MKKKIEWLPAAKNDLKHLSSYYMQYAWPSMTANMVQRIKESTTLLADMPYLGVQSKDNKHVFEWHLKKYSLTIPYIINGEFLTILRVFHQAQERPHHWRKK